MGCVCHRIHIIEKKTHKKKKHQKLQNHFFLFLLSPLKKKTNAAPFASAGSSLLVMHNLDQTIKIIYALLDPGNRRDDFRQSSFYFPFQCQSHLLKNSLFAISSGVNTSVSLLPFLQLTMFASQLSNWNQSWVNTTGAAGGIKCDVICAFSTYIWTQWKLLPLFYIHVAMLSTWSAELLGFWV